ncbi:hypothetical protein pb186bvf_015660 [Paramecium bursaria]
MSFLSKFTSIFQSQSTTDAQSSPSVLKLEELLTLILKPQIKFDSKICVDQLINYLSEREDHLDLFFSYIKASRLNKLAPLGLVKLLSTIHQAFATSDFMYEIAIKLRESRFQWLQQESKMLTEADEDRQRGQSLTEAADNDNDIWEFIRNYYTYLQRVAANVDLFRSVQKDHYPYTNEKEYIEPKLMFLWHYKIQNTMNTALVLLKFDLQVAEIQKFIYDDVLKFQNFLSSEITKVVDSYATLPNSDTLSLNEILSDSFKHYDIIKKFHTKAKMFQLQEPKMVQIDNGSLQEFQGFIAKLKVLNQMTFKKSIKVPNKQNPCMGVPTHNPNVIHLKATSGQFKKYQQEDSIDESEESDSIEVQDVVEDLSDKKKKTRKHQRGQSTFQQN